MRLDTCTMIGPLMIEVQLLCLIMMSGLLFTYFMMCQMKE